MENFKKYVKSHVNQILLITITAILCVTCGLIFHRWPKYVVLGNMFIGLFFSFSVWLALYKGGDYRKDFLLKLVCVCAMLIAVNRLFTMEAWIVCFPILSKVDPTLLFFVGMFIVLLTMGIYKLLPHYKQKTGRAGKSGRREDGQKDKTDHTGIPDQSDLGGKRQRSRETGLYLLFGICALLVMAAIISVPVARKLGIAVDFFDQSFVKQIIYAAVTMVLITVATLVLIGVFVSFVLRIWHMIKNLTGALRQQNSLNGDGYRIISLVAAGVMTAAAVMLPDESLKNVQNDLISGRWLAGSVRLLSYAVLFGFLTVAIYMLIILISENKLKEIKDKLNKEPFSEYVREIGEIIKNFFEVILGTIGGTLKFVLFIPSFLEYMQKMIEGDDKDGTNEYGMRTIRIAALCFAIVSWYATAQGLSTYVFAASNAIWEAGLISFAIQSILFVLNLKLPAYLRQIRGRNVNNSGRRPRYSLSQRIGSAVFAVFYVAILTSSSIFSFFHFTDQIYQGTQYADATITLKKSYKETAAKAKEYIAEGKKLTLQIITGKVGELSTMLEASLGDGKKYPELNDQQVAEELEKARHDMETKKTDWENRKQQAETAAQTYNDYVTGPEYKQIIEQLREEMEEAIKLRDNAYGEYSTAKQTYDLLYAEKERRENSHNAKANELLVETLKPTPNPAKIGAILEELINNLTSSKLSDFQQGKFSDAVLLTREISTTLDQYERLVSLESRDGSKHQEMGPSPDEGGALAFQNVDSIEPPAVDQNGVPDPDGVQTWSESWSVHIYELRDIIYDIPQFTEKVIGETDATVVNGETLRAYQELKDAVDVLTDEHRSTLPQANVIEKSWSRLWGAYPLLAWFSLIFAFFLDMSSLAAGWLTYKLESKQNEQKVTKSEQQSTPAGT